MTEEAKREIAAVPFDEADMISATEVNKLFGDPHFTPRERVWARPTLEINGMWGGFQGEGVKTFIPREAHGKITCRLVPDQDPQDILEKVQAHARKHAPPGIDVAFQPFPGTARPYLVPADTPANRVAAEVLEEVFQSKPVCIRHGGSLPVCSLFLEHLGVYTLIFAFGAEDEKQHALDEFFRLSNFGRGLEAYCKLLSSDKFGR